FVERVLSTPRLGRMVFTDASSRTQRAVVVWEVDGKWEKMEMSELHVSVQYLEALAVSRAMTLWPNEHTNIETDSMFVYRLVQSMSAPGWAGTDIALLLEDALQCRHTAVTVMHTRSHTNNVGYFQHGNGIADRAATQAWTIRRTKELHEFLHLGARALAKCCNITTTE
ncbi:POL1 protein, partial [Piaya cayana]|nr:POL1 protein [Piaya cayana]